MKFSAGMIVINGMPWIPYILKNLYPVMDEIIVVEGATESASEIATADGHSLDETVSAIKNFADPERKIKLIQRDGFWPEKLEMSQAYAEACTGDYLWQVDGDEFYFHHDVLWLQDYLRHHQEIHTVSFKVLQFFGGKRAVMKGARFCLGGDIFWRLFRWHSGYQYVDHRPPTIHTEYGADTRTFGVLEGETLAREHGIYMYHYSYIFPAQVRYKTRYYEDYRLMAHRGVSPAAWYSEHFEKLTPWRIHLDKRPLSYLAPFKGEHPPEINELFDDIEAGKLAIETRPSDDIDRLFDSGRWRIWQLLSRIDRYVWTIWDGPLRDLLRPFVRVFRSRFRGYSYD